MNGLESTAGLPDLAAFAVQKSPGAPASLPADPSPLLKGRGVRLFSPHSEVQGGKEVHPLTLKELTKGICRGDEAAFTRFYDLYSLRIYKYLLVMARGGEREARGVLMKLVVKHVR